MFKKIIHFIKYNNATVLIIGIIFVIGASALASETGQAAIGQKQTTIAGVDNTLLLAADLDKFDMDFKIEKIEEDEEIYYVTYTYLDLVEKDNAWQYQLKENTRRISKKTDKDLGVYLAEELKEEYEARIKELKAAQDQARENGEEKRTAVTEYSGLIGASLDLAAKIFPDYEPVKKVELESPVPVESLRELKDAAGLSEGSSSSGSDNLTQVYKNYIQENDPDSDNVFGANDNCPTVYNPDQLDSDGNGVGDICETEEPAVDETEEERTPTEGQTVEVINLPAEEPVGDSKPAGEPVVEEETAPTDGAMPADNPTE